MHLTGVENLYVMKNNKKLRCGYTTGSCAAAAAKAAAQMLLTGKDVSEVQIMTPAGVALNLEILDIKKRENSVSCAVRKDGGDDPDVTTGLLIYAEVSRCLENGIFIDGGKGVGRITRKGMSQAIGEAAINPVPKKMIETAVSEVYQEEMELGNPRKGGLKVVISIPKGEEIAEKTFNPRLGIEGGISILGTKGIVVPMSEEALIASIRLEMKMKVEQGEEYLLITPGNYGADYLREHVELTKKDSVKCSNYVGETLDAAAELGAKGILFVAHIGKFIKVSGGIMNTHSRHADSRAELMAAHAIRAGADLETARQLLDTITTEEALDILKERGLLEPTMAQILEKIRYYLQHRCGGMLETEAILFSNAHGYLGETSGVKRLVELLEIQGKKAEIVIERAIQNV